MSDETPVVPAVDPTPAPDAPVDPTPAPEAPVDPTPEAPAPVLDPAPADPVPAVDPTPAPSPAPVADPASADPVVDGKLLSGKHILHIEKITRENGEVLFKVKDEYLSEFMLSREELLTMLA